MKKKKLAGILMTLLLVAGVLAGCNSDSAGSKASEEVLIGANLELTGGVASYGQSIYEGANLALKEINKKGINGKQLKLVKYDNKSEAQEAMNGALKLINQDKVVAIIGSATSTNTLAQVALANKYKTPIITATGTSPEVTVTNGKLNDYVFRTCFIDPFQGTVAANFSTKNLGAKTAAIYIDNSSDYSKGLAASFKESFEKNGGSVVAREAYLQKDTDFRATLTRIKSEKPDFIYIPGYYEEVGLIVKQARESGIDVPIMGADGWDSPKLLEIAGKDALANTFITNHYSSSDPDVKIQSFVEAFQKEYKGKKPDAFAALGYDTAYFLAEAIKNAGEEVTGENIQKALAETKNLQLVSGAFTIDENHNPIKSATILRYEKGEQVFETKVNP
ncbi:ABC transporter substrate-binding protein [Peribacillus loiseleuriae]|uniref:ABC transporter substrate-binding protein n=1 Tax=Peribacillus loiseleuriae TaxID=1679170 RepID=UPI003D0938BF